MNDNQIQALKAAAKMKRESSIKKMNDAILKMQSEGLPIIISYLNLKLRPNCYIQGP